MYIYAMDKQERLITIGKIIREENIFSQEDLLKKLEGRGISCTQATLSRNLRQLRASRIPYGEDKLKYVVLPGAGSDESETPEIRDFSGAVTSMVWAHNMMLVKTMPGYAAAVASLIDRSERMEIAGTIAGDDTILVVPHNNFTEENVNRALRMILQLQ